MPHFRGSAAGLADWVTQDGGEPGCCSSCPPCAADQSSELTGTVGPRAHSRAASRGHHETFVEQCNDILVA